MRWKHTLVLSAGVLAAGCADDPTRPVLTAPVEEEAKSQRAVCRPSPLSTETTGEIAADDCLFDGAGRAQQQDIYLAIQSRLGRTDRSGSTMLTFTGAADFDAIFGVGAQSGEIFPDPVYGFARFDAGATGIFGNSFSIIGSDPVYKMWFGGQDGTQLGSYTLTTAVEPSIDTCENGHWVFLQGSGSFSSDIANDVSCRGTVEFGPFVGAPLNYQFWYIKLLPGETFTATLDGVTDPTVALAAIDFGTGQAELDLGDGPGDPDRAISFTATRQLYLYVEVSSAPDITSPYTLSFTGP